MTNERQTFTYRETNDGGSVVDETIERQYRGFWHREFSMSHTGDRFPVDRVRTEDMRIIVRHASAIDIRQYGAGAYRTYVDLYVDACILSGFADDSIGDTSTNGTHYARVNGPLVDYVDPGDDLTNAEVRWLDENGTAGAIAETTDQGFVYVRYFENPADLDRAWDRIVASLAEPGEDDLTTEDDRTFYLNDRKVLYWSQYRTWQYWDPSARNFRSLYSGDRVQSADEFERAIVDYCNRVQYWPNVWRISDHGNAHRLTIAEVSE